MWVRVIAVTLNTVNIIFVVLARLQAHRTFFSRLQLTTLQIYTARERARERTRTKMCVIISWHVNKRFFVFVLSLANMKKQKIRSGRMFILICMLIIACRYWFYVAICVPNSCKIAPYDDNWRDEYTTHTQTHISIRARFIAKCENRLWISIGVW